MSLRFIGEEKGVCWVFLEAVDAAGDRVRVRTSHEAEERHGLDIVREAARRKYAYRHFESNGEILVLSIDCKKSAAAINPSAALGFNDAETPPLDTNRQLLKIASSG
jgi:hypothetical protein